MALDDARRQERNQARRSALNLALKEQVASYSGPEEENLTEMVVQLGHSELENHHFWDVNQLEMGHYMVVIWDLSIKKWQSGVWMVVIWEEDM